VLDFVVAPYDADLSSPVIDLLREDAKMQLTLLGEVMFGIAVNVEVDEVDELFKTYLARGLDTSMNRILQFTKGRRIRVGERASFT